MVGVIQGDTAKRWHEKMIKVCRLVGNCSNCEFKTDCNYMFSVSNVKRGRMYMNGDFGSDDAPF